MTHITIEKEKLEKVFYALTAAKHGNLDNEWAEEVLAICKQALAAPTVQEPVSDTEIAAWAERHDIQGTPTDLRGMFEDAASFTNPPAAQPAPVQQTVALRAALDEAKECFEAIGADGGKAATHAVNTISYIRSALYTTPPAQPAPVQEPLFWYKQAA